MCSSESLLLQSARSSALRFEGAARRLSQQAAAPSAGRAPFDASSFLASLRAGKMPKRPKQPKRREQRAPRILGSHLVFQVLAKARRQEERERGLRFSRDSWPQM